MNAHARILLIVSLSLLGCDQSTMLLGPVDAGDDGGDGDAVAPDSGVGDDAGAPDGEVDGGDDAAIDPPSDAAIDAGPIDPPEMPAPTVDLCVEGAQGVDIAALPDGSAVLVGSYRESVRLGDLMLEEADGFYDGFVAIVDGSGTPTMLSRVEGRSRQGVSNVVAHASGEISISGDFLRDVDVFGTTLTAVGSGWDAYLARLGTDGTLRWVRHLGGDGIDRAFGLAPDGAGGVSLLGGWSLSFPLLVDPEPVNWGEVDIFTARYDAAGTLGDVRSFGASGNDVGHDIILNTDGRTVVVGELQNAVRDSGPGTGGLYEASNEGFVASYSDGIRADDDRLRRFPLNAHVESVAAAPDGELVIGGRFRDGGDLGLGPLGGGTSGAFLAWLTDRGTILWSIGFEGVGSVSDVHVLSDGSVVATGGFSYVDFGGGPLSRTGGTIDAYALRLSPEGEYLGSYAIPSDVLFGDAPSAVAPDESLWVALFQRELIDPIPECLGTRLVRLPAP